MSDYGEYLMCDCEGYQPYHMAFLMTYRNSSDMPLKNPLSPTKRIVVVI